MPSVSTVHEWMKADDAFSGSIARARKDGFDVIAADCLKIADTPKTGKIVKRSPDGTTETIEDMLGHRKLQIDTRLKLLAKWDPKRYGDKQEITHGVTEDMALVMKRIRQRREN